MGRHALIRSRCLCLRLHLALLLCSAPPGHHGRGTVLYSWHPSSHYLATVGTLTSLIGGTNNLASASGAASSGLAPGAHLPPQTRCVWLWAMPAAAEKDKGQRRREKANATETPEAAVAAASTAANAAASTAATPAVAGSNASSSAASSAGAMGAVSAAAAAVASIPQPVGGATLLCHIVLPHPAPCIGLEWDATGSTLAILQASPAHEVLLWNFATRTAEHVDLSIKDPTFMRWSRAPGSNQLAIGTGRGELLLYDRAQRTCWYANARHKKRITCGDWNSANQFAFASDDRQITICSADGKTFGQVKVKSRPTNVKFGAGGGGGGGGAPGGDAERENIVSVSMDRKTILLYNLDDPENALELAFQQRYGHIVSFKWFRDGYVMVGFSLGFLVVISTHLDEIGREQFCARFHKDSLRDIAYSSARHRVATAGENVIKIVDLRDWKEIRSEEIEPTQTGRGGGGGGGGGGGSGGGGSHSGGGGGAHGHGAGPLDKLSWTPDGNYLSVSTRNGCLYVYGVDCGSGAGSGGSGASACGHQSESQSLLHRLLYQPLSGLGLLACASTVLASGALMLASATGLSLTDMARLTAGSWSV